MKRILLGDRSQWAGGGLDLWVSKPGHDVRYANYGNLMLGGNTGISQVLHSEYLMVGAPPAFAHGITHYINLPPQFAGLSNLVVIGRFEIRDGNPGNAISFSLFDETQFVRGAFRLVNGQVEARHYPIAVAGNNPTYGHPNTPRSLWCGYTVYRASMS